MPTLPPQGLLASRSSPARSTIPRLARAPSQTPGPQSSALHNDPLCASPHHVAGSPRSLGIGGLSGVSTVRALYSSQGERDRLTLVGRDDVDLDELPSAGGTSDEGHQAGLRWPWQPHGAQRPLPGRLQRARRHER